MAKKDGREKGDEREKGSDEDEHGENGGDERKPPSRLEILASAFSALLVAALIAIIIWDATHESTPPAFEARAGTPQLVGSVYRLPIVVHNTGDEAARSVVVHVEMRNAADSVLSESDLTVDWLPGKSDHELVAFFEKPNMEHRFMTDVRGFTQP